MIILALGTNLGERENNLAKACFLLEKEGCQVIKKSTIRETVALSLNTKGEPVLDSSLPAYLNQVIAITTALSPEELLNTIHKIEKEIGRDRSSEVSRWLPRVIDIDIILYHDLNLDTPHLKIPHPEMLKRDFVYGLLAEIYPELL